MHSDKLKQTTAPTASSQVGKKRKTLIERLIDKQNYAKTASATRVILLSAFGRWRDFRESKMLKTDAMVAHFLLDSYERHLSSSGEVAPQSAALTTTPLSDRSLIQIDACRDQQSTCLPSLHVSEKRSSSGVVHPEHVSFSEHTDLSVLEDVCVNLGCLLQLFQRCERCRGVCAVSTRGDGEHFSVLGRCKDCSQQTTWSNQPVGVSDELVNPPPDQGKGHMETPETLAVTSTVSNRHIGTGVNKRKAEGKTDKLFVEMDVMIDTDGEQSVDEEFGPLEEEEEEMEGAEMSDMDVKDRRQEEEKENGEIKNVESRKLLIIKLPKWKDWQTEKEGEEEVQMDGDDGDKGEEEDSDSDSESDCEEKKKMGNIEGSRNRQGRHKRRDRLTPLLCPDCGVTYASYRHKCQNKCSECGLHCASEIILKDHKLDCRGRTHACKYCLKRLATREDKLNHEEQNHSKMEDEPYSCPQCPQRFSSIRKRRLHFKEHKICPTCHKRFTKSDKLKRHMLSHISDEPLRYKRHRSIAQSSDKLVPERCTTCCSLYHCPLCTEEMYKPTHASKIQLHLEVHERNAIPFKDMKIYRCNLSCREHGHFHCPVCEKTIIRKRDMEGHLKTYSSAPASPVAAPPQSTPVASISSSPTNHSLPLSRTS